MAGSEGDVYATLLLSDTYLPGALVLARSLRDAGTTKKLAVLVTLDTVSAEVITQLKTVYDIVIPVSRMTNATPANLHLMNRADLHSAFTKINLWKQLQFRKIVYIDADVLAYRAPDELFDISHPFSAAPDIGWPDLFNSGVMVLTPNMGDYYAMMAMAERGISFDGADQGLLNMHFRNNYNRISFTYNVTPSAHYQYIPAYRHFQSSINMVHFIGSNKPWFEGRRAGASGSPYDEMVGRWWAVYDRHYRVPSPTSSPSELAPELVQYFTKGEYQPPATQVETTGEPYVESGQDRSALYRPPPPHQHPTESSDQVQSHGTQHHYHHHHHKETQAGAEDHQPEQMTSFPSASFTNVEGMHAEARKEQVSEQDQGFPPPPPEPVHKAEPFQPTLSDWDAQRHPPPADSRPEAMNFPSTVYEMSQDTAPFVPPERYPSPPKDMWYEVPKEKPAAPSEKPKPIFPWETHQPVPTRVFAHEPYRDTPTGSGAEAAPSGEPWPASKHRSSAEPSFTDSSTVEHKSEPVTPTTPTSHVTPSDPWTAFTRTNAWDEIPEIERYVDSMQKHKRTRSLKSPGVIGLPSPGLGAGEVVGLRRGSKLTDFPSEVERPSLPVTPAPIRRPKFWGGGGPGDDDLEESLLPAAEGVPAQTDWDPVAQLQKLAKQQSEVLLQKLGGGKDDSRLPSRPLPFGSEELTSPTHVARSAAVLSPQPVKGSETSSMVRGIASEDEAIRHAASHSALVGHTGSIPEPSYSGPSAAFEKGEDYPASETPALPTEEERDVLET